MKYIQYKNPPDNEEERTEFISDTMKDSNMVVFYCPSCGQVMGAFTKKTVSLFKCKGCGAVWECANCEEIFGE